MREMFKRRLAVMLSMLLVLPTVLALLPMARLETEAASFTGMNWYFYSSEAIQIEEGQEFYIGDYVVVYYGVDPSKTASMVKASYSSSKTKVASVDSKGYLKALKTGTTTIKVAFKGKSVTQEFEVVEKGTFTEQASVQKFIKAAEELPTSVPSSITTKNGFALCTQLANYKKAAAKLSTSVDENGFLVEKVKSGSYSYYQRTNQLAVPQAGRHNTVAESFSVFAKKNDPTSTHSSKGLKVSSITINAKKNVGTIKLKNKVTKEHILAAKMDDVRYYAPDVPAGGLNDKQAFVYATVMNKGKYYSAFIILKQGSKQATFKIYSSTNKNSKTTYKNTKFKSGQTYSIGSKYEWTKGKSVKAK
ncbi:MAG: Ig-like domain-containing protein [Lachnospiraceae bacterium]|nr:Ig-like domain-containing protein [Lachnospiraceae bacterium]